MRTAPPRGGAPGIYLADRRRDPELSQIRLDVAGFAGVSPRGPVDQPVTVESWSDFRWRFGGTEGPGLLAYAVRTFFSQGGSRAVICRLSPVPRAPDVAALEARALHTLTIGAVDATGNTELASIDLRARDEGSWGDRLEIVWSFTAGPHFNSVIDDAELTLPAGMSVVAGSTLRLRGPGLPPGGVLRGVASIATRIDADGRRRPIAALDLPLVALPSGATYDVDVITVTVRITDTDPSLTRVEVLEGLGLRPGHPSYVRTHLRDSSLLIEPAGTWPDVLAPADPYLPTASTQRTHKGIDRWSGIGYASLFGDVPVELLPRDGRETAEPMTLVGVDALAVQPELGMLSVPDLSWNRIDEKSETEQFRPSSQAEFGPCPPEPRSYALRPAGPQASRLDARIDWDEVLRRQHRLVDLAEHQVTFVALLDVPEHLSIPAIARWRAEFDSSYTAAYHPWLGVMPEDPNGTAVFVGPSAFAAGIIADREHRLGIPWGPANAIGNDAVISASSISDADHDTLHRLDIDVFRAERNGFRLTAAHTLATDSQYRQLSVRRLMTMLRLVLFRQSQWLAFEPNTSELRLKVARSVTQLLRDLFRSGAFAASSENEAFFVRCDDTVNPRYEQDLGRLIAEVGVAPASPLEYIVLRISQDVDGLVKVEG
jgi:hypothetical protein